MKLENIYYINLKERNDRKIQIENELKEMGWNNYTRFEAIKHENGAIGCYLSHLKLLKHAKEKKLDYIVIMEDDIQFYDKDKYKSMLNYFFENNIDYDVLLMTTSTYPYKNCDLINKKYSNTLVNKIDNYIYKINGSLTTTGYIVKNNYYDKIINIVNENLNNLINHPNREDLYAIDSIYLKLQKKDNWLILLPRTVTQRESYSNIRKTIVNYDKYMLDDIL